MIVRLHSTMEEARTAWQSLAAPSVFSTWDYARAWWTVFGRGRLLCVEGAQDGVTKIMMPSFADGGLVYFIGSGSSDYLDFLNGVENSELMEAMLRTAMEATADFQGFCFYHVPDSSGTGKTLRQIAPRLGLRCSVEYSMPAPKLKFALAAEKHAQKKSLVRHENRMRREGELGVSTLRTSMEILPLLADFYEQCDARARQAGRPETFKDVRQRRFLEELATVASKSVLLTRLTWSGNSAAYHFGFCFGGSFLWYKPCFAPELARYSPGEVLLRHSLLYAESADCKEFDFGLGDEAYKERFATSVETVTSWRLCPEGEAR